MDDKKIIDEYNDLFNELIQTENTIIQENELEELIPFETLTLKIDHSGDFKKDHLKILSRHYFIDKFGIFGIPSIESLEGIVGFAKQFNLKSIIDVGAGLGYLSYGLDKVIKQQNESISVTAIDDFSFWKNKNFKQWFPIQNVDTYEYLKDINNSLIILCWPNYQSDFALGVANIVLKNNNKLIYIGEPSNGCTANDDFFSNYNIKPLQIPWTSWMTIHDDIYEVGENEN